MAEPFAPQRASVDAAVCARILREWVTSIGLEPSAYAIGLRTAWIFSQPFETWPIELAGSEPWKAEQDSASVAESLALLRELMPTAFDGHDQSSK